MDETGGEGRRAVPARSTLGAQLAESYHAEIERLMGEGSVQDALDKLQDFARDFAPQLKRDVVQLRGEFRILTSEVRRGLAKREDLRPVEARVLDVNAEVYRSAVLDRAAAATPSKPNGGSSGASEAPGPEVDPTRDTAGTDRESSGSIETLDDRRRIYWQQFHKDRPPTETVAFKAEGISKAYRKSAFQLQEVSFELRVGEITGVVGRNASGKTTLLRIVMGDLMPDTGKASYPMLTRDRGGWGHIKRQIADVPQSLPKWHGRLRPNLNYVAAMHGIKGERISRMAIRADGEAGIGSPSRGQQIEPGAHPADEIGQQRGGSEKDGSEHSERRIAPNPWITSRWRRAS